MELKCRMIAGHANVILLARLQDARAELIEAGIILRRLDLVHKLAGVKRDHILLAQLPHARVERHPRPAAHPCP